MGAVFLALGYKLFVEWAHLETGGEDAGAGDVLRVEHGHSILEPEPLSALELVADGNQLGVGDEASALVQKIGQAGCGLAQLQYSFHRRSTFSLISGFISRGSG